MQTHTCLTAKSKSLVIMLTFSSGLGKNTFVIIVFYRLAIISPIDILVYTYIYMLNTYILIYIYIYVSSLLSGLTFLVIFSSCLGFLIY